MKKITLWGTFDDCNYDIKNLINGLQDLNYDYQQININIWNEKDKSQITKKSLIIKIIKLIFCYPPLLYKYLKKVKKNEITIISYPGWLDIFLIHLLAKIKQNKVYFFIFISLYDTVVLDRQIIKNKFVAKIIYLFEKVSYNLCDRIYVDTIAHKTYLSKLFHIKKEKIFVSYQGISKEFIDFKKNTKKNQVLYFGKYIPLHGIKNIISVMNNCPRDLDWLFIGDGPDKKYLDKFIEKNRNIKIKTIKWLNINDLKKVINESRYVMGIFGNTDKAQNVIPLKIFMSINSANWIITRKTKAINEIKSANIITVDKTDEIPSILTKYKDKKINIKNSQDHSYIEKAKNFIRSIESK